MPDRSRSPNAARKASFGRADRLRREAGAPPRDRGADRPARLAKGADRAAPSRTASRTRRLLPLHQVRERLERVDAATARSDFARLKERARSEFTRTAERRRDTGRRAEHDRKRDALQQKERRLQEHQRRANVRRLERKRGELKKEFARKADRRDHVRRAHLDRLRQQEQARRLDLQRRAAAEIEREQKRREADQQAAHRRQTDAMRSCHKGERNSFRINEQTAELRHHARIQGIDAREERELAEFDGRRKGLAGRAAELIPGRRAEYDRQREEMVRGYEAERLAKHRELEAFKERSFENEHKKLREQAMERKLLMEIHRDDRGDLQRRQEEARPRQIEERAGRIERAEQARDDRVRAEPERENVRPSPEFSAAASGRGGEHSDRSSELTRESARDISPPAPERERA